MRGTLVIGRSAIAGRNAAHRIVRAAFAACALSIVTASAALAAVPTSPGCLGESAAAAGSAGGRDFGQVVALTATTSTQGLGDEVQLILAGDFPDDAFQNTCND